MQNARALHEGAPVALALSLTPFAALLQSIPSRPALARGSAAIDILFDPRYNGLPPAFGRSPSCVLLQAQRRKRRAFQRKPWSGRDTINGGSR